MRKRLLALLLASALCAALIPAAASEAASGRSGLQDIPKLTQSEIIQLLRDNPLGFSGAAMEVEPVLQDPFTTGTVSQAALDTAMGRLNLFRALAGLPKVELDETLTRNAQYGAVLLAATGELTHFPSKPAGMDDNFYQKGKTATGSSNVYKGTNATLPQAVEAYFDDSDAANVSTLGHRRWMLNPTMGKTGLGFSPSNYTYAGLHYNFATLWAFDRSGAGGDYQFIAWPASGNFPNSLFYVNEAWSVTLDPKDYAAPVLSELTVTLRRESDGQTWTLSGQETYVPASGGSYLNVDTGNYGVSNCVIFRPELDANSYNGTYTVTIAGLRTADGAETALRYQVDFFDPADGTPTVASQGVELNHTSLELEVGEIGELVAKVLPEDATEGRVLWASDNIQVATVRGGKVAAVAPGTATITARALDDSSKVGSCVVTVKAAPAVYLDVPAGIWYESPVYYVTRRGLFQGVGNSLFDPEGHMSRVMAMTVLARIDGTDVTPQAGEPWYLRAQRWAVTNKLTDGLDPEKDITREELAVMLYRYAKLRNGATAAQNYRLAAMPDGDTVSAWAAEGVNWAVDAGIMIGDEHQLLHPQDSIRRMEVAIIFQRYADLFEGE